MRQFWLMGALWPLLSSLPFLSSLSAPRPTETDGHLTTVALIDQEAPSRFAQMNYKHERTFLNVDVVQLHITVADEVGREVERLVASYHEATSGSRPRGAARAAAEALKDSIANACLHATHADVSMRFLRTVTHGQFMGGRDDALEVMVEEALLTEAEAELLAEDMDQLFAFLRSDPIRKGHEIRYTVRGDTVKTLVLWEDGTVAQNIVRAYPEYRLYTMGSLFAPGAEFHDGLMRTILDPNFPARE